MPKRRRSRPRRFRYDATLSFAGDDRKYVERVANGLRERGIRVFYDDYERANLWGKDLYAHLDDVYRNAARYCVLFISRHYKRKLWTNHERRSAQARAFAENYEYVLPARFDSTEMPGLLPTVGYIDLRTTKADQLVDLITSKVGLRPKRDFVPPIPDKLYEALGVRKESHIDLVDNDSHSFVEALHRMSAEERELLLMALVHGCPGELPENVHVSLDLLRRVTHTTPSKIVRVLEGIGSLGFTATVRTRKGHQGQQLVLAYMNLTDGGTLTTTPVAYEMVRGAMDGYCSECGLRAVLRGDFSQLATVTTRTEAHARKPRKSVALKAQQAKPPRRTSSHE